MTDAVTSWLAPLELAGRFGVSRRRVYDWIYAGWLRAIRVGYHWQVSEQDAAFFAETCRGYRGRLMPSLYEWELLWSQRVEDGERLSIPSGRTP